MDTKPRHKISGPIIWAQDSITVRLGSANRAWYELRGYIVKGKDFISVVPNDLPHGSGVSVSVICPRCRKVRTVKVQELYISGHSYCRSCANYICLFQDISGKRFGRLTAIEPVGKDRQNATKWLCACDCGKMSIVAITRLNNGMTSSCGCLRIERTIEAVSGEKNRNYNPNLTDENRIDRRIIEEYRNWQYSVKVRDNFTCRVCGVRGGKYLASHHLNAWFSYPEQRFDVDNGVCLCSTCHKAFHAECGRGHNTRQQFVEWIQKNV